MDMNQMRRIAGLPEKPASLTEGLQMGDSGSFEEWKRVMKMTWGSGSAQPAGRTLKIVGDKNRAKAVVDDQEAGVWDGSKGIHHDKLRKMKAVKEDVNVPEATVIREEEQLNEGRSAVRDRIYGEVMAAMKPLVISTKHQKAIKDGISDAYDDGYDDGAKDANL